MNIESLFEGLVAGGIRSPDLEKIKKFRALNIFLIILILFTPLLGLFYLFIGANILFYATIIACLLWVSDMMLLRKTKNLIVAGNYAFFVLWATLLIIRWNTGAVSEGGIIPLSWIWNAVLILMAIFITGYKWGTIWATLIFVEAGLVLYLFRGGYPFPNLLPPDVSPIYSLGTYLSGLLVILLIAFMYEKEKDDVDARELIRSRALVESKRYIDAIIERFPLPTFVIDREHRVIQWNRACQQIIGVPAAEIVGKKVPTPLWVDNQGSLADIIIEAPDSIVERFSGSIVSKEENSYLELEMPLPAIKGGIKAIVTVAPIADINGSIKGAIETIQEVTDLPGEVSRAYANLDRGVEPSSDPMFKIDSKGKISFWNKACEEDFGYPSSTMIGNSPLTFVSKSSKGPFKKTIVRVFKGESFNREKWKYYSAQGEPVWVRARAYLVEAIEGKTARECVVISTNITDFKLRMKELQSDMAEGREKLKTMTEEFTLLRKNLAAYARKRKV